jgi:hypothetical protein
MNETPIQMAATVILWHEKSIYLIQRHKKSGFMGNAHVFPGGRLDDADLEMSRRLSSQTQALCLQRCPMTHDRVMATALCWAALRETAEESGMFMCQTPQQNWPTETEQREAQKALQAGQSFNEIVTQRNWRLVFDALHPVAWWLTPPVEKRRYNTIFFALQLPQKMSAAPDPRETHGGQWWTPHSLFEAYFDHQLFLAPPTYSVMEDIRDCPDFKQYIQKQRPDAPICPVVELQDNGTLNFYLPGHHKHLETKAKVETKTRIALQMPQGGLLHSIYME